MQNQNIEESKEVVIFGHGQREDSLSFLVFTHDGELPECSTLSKQEQTMLDECEQIIQRDHEAFFECGDALATVKRGKLYRAEYRSFKEYCSQRWGFGPVHANRLIQASEAMGELHACLEAREVSLPKTERELRPLTKLDALQRVEALKLANELAGSKRRTGKHVEQAVEQLFGTPKVEDVTAANTSEPDDSDDVVVQGTPVIIEKPLVTPAQLFELIEEIQGEIDEIGTMQATVNQLGKLQSMLKAYIAQTNRSEENQNN